MRSLRRLAAAVHVEADFVEHERYMGSTHFTSLAAKEEKRRRGVYTLHNDIVRARPHTGRERRKDEHGLTRSSWRRTGLSARRVRPASRREPSATWIH
jgi:hypothetical protein